jgi:metacaspase-1
MAQGGMGSMGGVAAMAGGSSAVGGALSSLGGMMGNKNDDDRDVKGAQRAVKGEAGLANPPPPVNKQKKKSLLIGINYEGSKAPLQGCHQDVDNIHDFITSQGYPTDQKSQVVMRDDEHTDPHGRFWPTGANILAAMQWLVSEPGTCNFLHYSGHGGQIADTDGNRVSGFDSTIVPYDYEKKGQIPSGVLHKTLVSRLPPKSTLFMIFDCCHSGSVAELPFIYRSDEEGNISMMDNLKAGMRLVGAANNLIQGGFSAESIPEARNLLAGAQSFFKGLGHQGGDDEEGLQEQDFAEQYEHEKYVTFHLIKVE